LQVYEIGGKLHAQRKIGKTRLSELLLPLEDGGFLCDLGVVVVDQIVNSLGG